MYFPYPSAKISHFFQGDLVPFRGEWYLEAKICVQGVISLEVLLLPDLLSEWSKGVYVCLCICKPLHLFLYLSIYIVNYEFTLTDPIPTLAFYTSLI